MATNRSASAKLQPVVPRRAFLGKSNMAKLIAAFDWSQTSLGPIDSWNPNVQTAVSMMLQSPVPIILLWGPEGYTIYNDAYSEFAADRHPKLLGQTIVHAWPEVADFSRNALKQVLAGKALSYKDQTLMLFRNNRPEEVTMDLNYSPILGDSGRPAGVMAIVVETTDRVQAEARQKQAEASLRAEQERLRFLVQNATDIITVFDKQGAVKFQSPSIGRVLGRPPRPSDAAGNIFDSALVHPDDKAAKDKFLRKLIAAEPDAQLKSEFRMSHADGSWRYIEAVGVNLLHLPQLNGIILSSRDVTNRRQSEESLKESERRFRTLADNIQNLAWMASPEGYIYWYNSRWYEYTGMTYEEMMGDGWRVVEDPEELPDTIRHWKRAIKTGEPFELLANLRAADGTYRHFLTRVAPVRDEHGVIQQWLGTNTDVEDLRLRHALEQRMERLSAQHEALLKLNRTKDEFIALASHQLRTPASAVKQYIGVLLGGYVDPPLTDEQRQYLQTAYDSNERELHIINELLKTAQIDGETYQIDMRTQDILPIVRGCIAALQPTLTTRDQVLTLHTPKKPVAAKVDATEIGLVFTNLLENASKYSSTGSSITVSVKAAKSFVTVAVADTGVGIRKADQQRIFDKFTRIDNKLSNTVSGTGLGLYWVQQIVALHKGSVTLESAPGKGSKFTVRLPV